MIISQPRFIEDITPITPQTPVEEMLGICLNNMGFQDMVDIAPGNCFALKAHLETCPTCRKSHALGSHYRVDSFVNDCYTVRNIEQHCESRIISIEQMVEQHEVLSKIIQNPKLDSPLADLYVAEKGRSLTASEKDMFRFDDNKWSIFMNPDLENDVRAFLERVIPGLIHLLLHEEKMLKLLDVKTDTRSLQKLRNKLQLAVDVPRNHQKRGHIVKTIKTQLHDGTLDQKWDSLPHLGLENGVLDLNTCSFRPAQKEDYVKMTCGYSWLETVDPEVEAEVEDFFQKVYPVPEERELFQQWVGYCLTDQHNEKYLMLLTDRRSGFNAKSTVLTLVASALGDYAVKGDAALYYANDKHRSINDHSAGQMTYEKKRLLFVEETSAGNNCVLVSSFVQWFGPANHSFLCCCR